MYFSSITTEILISEVEIIWMLMPSSARVRNIWLAIPAWVRMPTPTIERSEEHTSELQSHSDLVCRLLLEKKKDIQRGGVVVDTANAISNRCLHASAPVA